jgi:hypothetical protein
MSRVEAMNQGIENYQVKFLEFTRIHAKKTASLICFFEGKDVKYYGIRIQENLPGITWEGINCGGKEPVLALCQILEIHCESKYRDAKTAFFVDRDFDPPLPAKKRTKIYETPGYSIENFYTSLSCFKKILHQEFKMSEDKEQLCFNRYITLFIQTQKQFHEAIAPLNAWIMLKRERERMSSLCQKTSLDRIKFKKLIKMELDRITQQYTIKDINLLFSEDDEISEEEVMAKIASFSGIECGKTFRGKYEIAFLNKFLIKLKNDLCASSPKDFQKKRKIPFSLPKNPSQMLSQFSQYADTPPCLKNYLVNLGVIP